MRHRELTLGLIKEAREFKKRLGLSYDSPLDVENVLLDLNVLTVFKPMSPQFSGMALKVDDSKFILVNSNHSLGRQNFTICHELYHLFIQEDFSSMICQVGDFKKTNPVEFKADYFAAQLLMPRFGIIDLIPTSELRENQISEHTLLTIESHFNCSRKALLHVLKLSKFITKSYFDKFLVDIKKGARNYGFDTDLYSPSGESKVIGNYATLARAAYNKEQISYTKLVNFMLEIGVNIEDSIDENLSNL